MVRRLLIPLVLLVATPASAQRPDFLFSKPRVTLGMRVGMAAPRAGSEVFELTTSELTLEREDFRALDLAFELGVRVHNRLDVTLNVGHSQSDTRSEVRRWVGTDDLPIEQTTEFARTPVTVGVKGYLKDRGQAVSRFAWIPHTWLPYVVLGGGFLVYDFSQQGEFVDYAEADGELRDIFFATYRSEGTAPVARAGVGVEASLVPHLLATAEATYLWSSAEMSRDFVDFDRIDLSGAQLAVGLSLRF